MPSWIDSDIWISVTQWSPCLFSWTVVEHFGVPYHILLAILRLIATPVDCSCMLSKLPQACAQDLYFIVFFLLTFSEDIGVFSTCMQGSAEVQGN